MTRLFRLLGGLVALVRRCRADAELGDELDAFLEASIEHKVAAGMNREAATRAARIEMGSRTAVTDSVRDAGWESRVEAIGRDLRNAARSLRRSPLFTAVAVLTLALGIGANTAIFSVVNSVMLRTLPVRDPQRLMLVSSVSADNQGWPAGWPYPIWEQLRAHADIFDGALAWSGVGSPIQFDLAEHGERDAVAGLYVSGGYFSTLGVSAVLGRTLTEADDRAGGGQHGPAAVISYDLWQRRFGGAADIVGRPLTVDHVPFTIVGVTPAGFRGVEVGRTFDVAVPIATIPLMRSRQDWLGPQGPAFLNIMVRLGPGQSADSAAATLRGVQAQVIDGAIPAHAELGEDPYRRELLGDPFTVRGASTGTSELRGMYGRPLVAMLAIVGIVLLIACANVATLMLARGAARAHELQVRLAIGAPRWRLVSHVLAESLLLITAGAIAALLLAGGVAPALAARLSAFGTAAVVETSLDWRVLAFTTAVTTLAGMLFGLAPALRASRTAPASLPRARSLRGVNGVGPNLSRAPLGIQVALTLVLLITAGLFMRTFDRLANRPPGFDSDRLLVVTIDASGTTVPPGARPVLYDRLLQTVAAVPGVARAAASEFTPVHFGPVRVSAVEIPGLRPEDRRPVPTYAITPGWFATYGSPLRAGRDIAGADTAGAPLVAVVNETFARMAFPGEDPIGRSVAERAGPSGQVQQITIVGIVGDAILGSLWDVVPPTMYVPLAQRPNQDVLPAEISITVRSPSGPPAALVSAVAAALDGADANLLFSFRVLEDAVNTTIAWERLTAVVSGVFGALALLLAGVGLYGVTSYAAAQRRAEIGVRLALGAPRRHVVALVVNRTFRIVTTGIMAGLAVAGAITRYLEGMLFGISPLDPAAFVAAALTFLLVAVVAAVLPARRAAAADPLVSLRAD